MADELHKHAFGSAETERKLSCLKAYLEAYCRALQSQHFALVYIDAFAGTGHRTETKAVLPFFGDGKTATEDVTTAGSARIALETKPSFHLKIFIENDPRKAQALQSFVDEFPNARAHVLNGDANAIVQRTCTRYSWKADGMRGVVFLDPYGMEVAWETVEAIAKTEALDCWYFFPLSGLYRNAPKDPVQLDDGKIQALNRLFGTEQWRSDWYAKNSSDEVDLLGHPIGKEQRIVDVDEIENWVHQRLKTVFKGTVLKPLRLKHSNGAPMASLFFAVSNTDPKAVGLATKIASHILTAGSSSHKRSR